MYKIGLDIGGTKIVVGLFDAMLITLGKDLTVGEQISIRLLNQESYMYH